MKKEVVAALEETLALLDDAQSESEGDLKSEIQSLWATLDKLLEKYQPDELAAS